MGARSPWKPKGAAYDHLGGYRSNYGEDKGGYFLRDLWAMRWAASAAFPGQANLSEGANVAFPDYDQKTTDSTSTTC